jgi:hypothetical protein
VLRRRASVAGLLVLKIGLLAIVLLHLLSPKEKAPPVRTELFFLFLLLSSEYHVQRINRPTFFA